MYFVGGWWSGAPTLAYNKYVQKHFSSILIELPYTSR